MVRADAGAADSAAALLTYGERGFGAVTPYGIHRVARVSRRTAHFRSGPSGGKLLADALLLAKLRAAVRVARADVVVAHHVEAAGAAAVARACPWIFVAHTTLAHELPSYFPRRVDRWASRAGELADSTLVRASGAAAAVAPDLARMLSNAAQREVRYLPVQQVQSRVTAGERTAARESLGLAPAACAILYVGNLDRYQGWDDLVHALARVRGLGLDAQLVLATASDTSALARCAHQAGVRTYVRIAPLGGETSRRALHAAADVAVVTRSRAGGVPIKLLDALSRGTPTVVVARGCAGLPLGDAVVESENDDPVALAECIARVACSPLASARCGLPVSIRSDPPQKLGCF